MELYKEADGKVMNKEDIRTLQMIASNCTLPKVQRAALLEIIKKEENREPIETQINRGYHCMEDYCEPEHTDSCVLCEAAYRRGYEAGRA